MDIKKQILILSEICQHDLELAATRARIASLTKQSDLANKNVSDLGVAIEDLNLKKEQTLDKYKTLDKKLQEEKSNLRKWEARADKIKGERDYIALNSEIGSLKRAITSLESELSQTNFSLQNITEQIKKFSGDKEENLGIAKNSFSSIKDLLEQEERCLTKQELEKNILLDKMPVNIKNNYQRIYEKRNRNAISFLENSVCQLCMRKIPHELSIKILKCEALEQCPSCQRYLVSKTVQN